MRRLTVFVRDDDLRGDLVRTALNAGYAASEETAREDVARIASQAGEALIIDVSEDADLQTISRLRRTEPGLAIIALASDSSLQRVVEAKRAGARELLRMPFDVESLERALARVVRPTPNGGGDASFVARDPGVGRLLEEASRAAATEATIRIVGPSGTGKTLLAERIHAESGRASGPLVFVNCAGYSETQAESELFGAADRGSATGPRDGRIRAAAGGTLVLEDVSELSLSLQPRLLRVLQEREIGGRGRAAGAAERVDVRVIATTQRDLEREVAEGRFREDLYYRLDVLELRIPPLRERPADVELLANALLSRFARQHGTERAALSAVALESLQRHPFPGNVRELENLMRRAAILFAGRDVAIDVLLGGGPATAVGSVGLSTFNLREVERETILRSLDATGGNRTQAAKVLGISVRTLRNKLQQYAHAPRGSTSPAHSAGARSS